MVVRWIGSPCDGDLASGDVDRDLPERELVPTLRLVGLASLPAQHRLDARQQLRSAERLRDVVVGADLEADDAVDLVALCREDDHRGRHPLAAQHAQHLDAAHAGKHHVEQDEVQSLVAGGLERSLAIGGGGHLVSLARQVEGECLPKGGIVLDEEQPASHRSPPRG